MQNKVGNLAVNIDIAEGSLLMALDIVEVISDKLTDLLSENIKLDTKSAETQLFFYQRNRHEAEQMALVVWRYIREIREAADALHKENEKLFDLVSTDNE